MSSFIGRLECRFLWVYKKTETVLMTPPTPLSPFFMQLIKDVVELLNRFLYVVSYYLGTMDPCTYCMLLYYSTDAGTLEVVSMRREGIDRRGRS